MGLRLPKNFEHGCTRESSSRLPECWDVGSYEVITGESGTEDVTVEVRAWVIILNQRRGLPSRKAAVRRCWGLVGTTHTESKLEQSMGNGIVQTEKEKKRNSRRGVVTDRKGKRKKRNPSRDRSRDS